jgi:hypothetical protein
MRIEEIEAEIIDVVNANQGGKMSDLLPKMSLSVTMSKSQDILLAIFKAMAEGEISLVEYTIEGETRMPKLILLPKCSRLSISQ